MMLKDANVCVYNHILKKGQRAKTRKLNKTIEINSRRIADKLLDESFSFMKAHKP